MVDISKIKVNDRITVRMIVNKLEVLEKERPIHALHEGSEILGCWLDPKNIVAHTPAPRPIVVGSPVRYDGAVCIVAGLDNGTAWVRFKYGMYQTVPAGSLTHDDVVQS